MTGPGPGKILVSDADCKLICKDKVVSLEDVEVYIHLKGYSYARVTHLDIEHPILDKIIEPGKGYFLKIYNYEEILRIAVRDSIEAYIDEYSCKVYYIEVRSKVFKGLINTPTRYIVTWVGGKVGGIYIGFKREQIRKLEYIAKEVYGFYG